MLATTLLAFALSTPVALAQSEAEAGELFAETFDAHWQRLNEEYPYFDLYDVDWEAERAEHRPRAIAATDPTEFAWELARLISSLPDPHVSFLPAITTMKGLWSLPDVDAHLIERRIFVVGWPEGEAPQVPTAFADDAFAYPEVMAINGEPILGTAEILVAGPLGTTLEVRLRWPDGSASDHSLRRPDEANLPPPPKHFGKDWLVTGRVGSIGYLAVKTFDPDKATLGPDGKMTTMLRAALAELKDTDGLILDFQGNGGGQVAASDPFLGNFLRKRLSYRWGNSGGKRRVIRPRSPRYRGQVVAIVDERSASGGEWAPRILRDAGRATVVGGRTAGAEAAVHTSTGPDGSVVRFSAWPMEEPGRTPFQETGIEVDHALPLTIQDVYRFGYDEATERVRRARFAKALELLGAPETDLDAVMALADTADPIAGKSADENP